MEIPLSRNVTALCNRSVTPFGYHLPFFKGINMKFKIAAIALAASFSLSAQAQTEIQWWHSMTAVNGEWVNDLAKDFNASQTQYKICLLYTSPSPRD